MAKEVCCQDWFRSSDLWVMSPSRYHCVTWQLMSGFCDIAIYQCQSLWSIKVAFARRQIRVEGLSAT
jgi:hypothetical protein